MGLQKLVSEEMFRLIAELGGGDLWEGSCRVLAAHLEMYVRS